LDLPVDADAPEQTTDTEDTEDEIELNVRKELAFLRKFVENSPRTPPPQNDSREDPVLLGATEMATDDRLFEQILQ
jgi:hypothetical protein